MIRMSTENREGAEFDEKNKEGKCSWQSQE
jgi:hypothetical protein